jgi:carboxymethylenebutenolidase
VQQLEQHQRYLIEEFAEDYQAHRLGRRDLLTRVLLITGSIPLTASLLFSLGCGSGNEAETPAPGAARSEPTAAPSPTAARPGVGPGVPENDPAIQASNVRFPGPASDILGYLARPAAAGTYPAVIVIHENQGLLDHFKDVSRRFAKEGFVALAIDLLSRQGGTSDNANQNTGGLGQTSPDNLAADMLAGVAYLKSQPFVKPSALGVTGFCFGGGQTLELAVSSPDIKAAVPYYGVMRMPERLPQTNAAILAMYGSTDTRVTSTAPDVEQRLKAAGKTVQIKIYEGAGHAFFNDTRPQVYNEAAAKDAWDQTLAWFRRYLT